MYIFLSLIHCFCCSNFGMKCTILYIFWYKYNNNKTLIYLLIDKFMIKPLKDVFCVYVYMDHMFKWESNRSHTSKIVNFWHDLAYFWHNLTYFLHNLTYFFLNYCLALEFLCLSSLRCKYLRYNETVVSFKHTCI